MAQADDRLPDKWPAAGASTCGEQEGQRACCVGGAPRSEDGLIEVAGCSGDCGGEAHPPHGDGLTQVGLLPDLVAELKQVGLSDADLEPLFQSSETYVKVWEKAQRTPSPPAALACVDVGTETLRGRTVSAGIRVAALRRAMTIGEIPPDLPVHRDEYCK